MKQMLSIMTALAALVGLSGEESAERPFGPYQRIVDRQMFGPVPDGFDPTKPPSEARKLSTQEEKAREQQEQKLKSAVRFSVINVTDEGDTAVGFTDNSDPKKPKHHYLRVGESSDGWTVKTADPVEASMTIEKDGIEISLTIGGDSSKDDKSTKKADVASGGRSASPFESLRTRRNRRDAERAKNEETNRKLMEQLKAAEERQAQEKAQREAERAEDRATLLALKEEIKRRRETEADKKDKTDVNGEAAPAND